MVCLRTISPVHTAHIKQPRCICVNDSHESRKNCYHNWNKVKQYVGICHGKGYIYAIAQAIISTIYSFWPNCVMMTQSGHHGITNHLQLDCFFNNLLWSTSMITSKLCITGERWIPSAKKVRIQQTKVCQMAIIMHSFYSNSISINFDRKPKINTVECRYNAVQYYQILYK